MYLHIVRPIGPNRPTPTLIVIRHAGIVDRRVRSGDDPCRSGVNLVGFCPVLLELTLLKCVQQARRPPAARRPQCAVKWDRNLKPKLAIMRQCTSVTDRRTDGQTDGQTDGHWHHSISARCIYYISR